MSLLVSDLFGPGSPGISQCSADRPAHIAGRAAERTAPCTAPPPQRERVDTVRRSDLSKKFILGQIGVK